MILFLLAFLTHLCFITIHANNVKITNVLGDGNCLFRSFAVSLYDHDDNNAHKLLRQAAAETLIQFERDPAYDQKDNKQMKDIITANLAPGQEMDMYGDSIEQYAKDYVAKDGNFVGIAECQALAMHFNRNVALISSINNWVIVYHPDLKQTVHKNIPREKYAEIWKLVENPIVILHDGFIHFNSVQLQLDEEVRFTCELLGAELALPKKELYDTIEKVLYERIKQNDDVQQSLSASITLFHTFCPNYERRKAALETIGKYVKNIIAQPNEQKFLKIRMGNKVFEEKVQPVKGAIEFLAAIGFRLQKSVATVVQQQSDGTTTTVISNEPYLVMTPPNEAHVKDLCDQWEKAFAQLENGKSVQLKLFRDAKLFKPNENVQQPKLTEGYCRIRVKFPSGYVVQGIFRENEKFSSVRAFVAEHISFKQSIFNLIPAAPPQKHGRKQLREENNTLKEYGLDQSGVVNFSWDAETQEIINQLPDDQQPVFLLH
ncbi:hypothetical protein niasHS_009754 [Heterodera schachtii]|uniref:Ubiquitin thioesterase OTU1 n=1 Tax=Heterodera schachtii TaxID=97005 RepID=A0ABD2J3B2_HETSC